MTKRNSKLSNTYRVVLAGNPNVGKSTVFNCLTGMHQHTGNWAGKTVENAGGRYSFQNNDFILIDLPGTYSLFSRSYEEQCAEEQLSFGDCDATVVVADANCLERNLNLVLQILKITDNVVLAVNLMDEAEKNGVVIDFPKLSELLKIPVVPMSAGRKRGLTELKREILKICENPLQNVHESDDNGRADKQIRTLSEYIGKNAGENNKNDYYAMRLLYDISYSEKLFTYIKMESSHEILSLAKTLSDEISLEFGSKESFCDYLTDTVAQRAKKIADDCVSMGESKYKKRLEKLDKIFMGKYTGTVTMLCLLLFILWITVYGANYPSQIISSFLLGIEDNIANAFLKIGVSEWLTDMLVHGGYKVLAWVVSVMLPPMAIFFPLFTLLEDFGYLPRVAFNLDYYFKKANTCGKQALTMCMGFGCNAVGVTGCRIIDSPRERIIAILTNNFVPCNGRFPTLIAVITMFFIAGATGFAGSLMSAALLCAVILFGIAATLAVSKILSVTLLKGVPSSFTLELPPYRKPQIGKTIIRSVFDRTLFVLGRAVSVAAPAGIVIWILANVTAGDKTLLMHCTEAMEPLGRLMGMDGVILTAFVLGFPANEIVIPIMLMAYMQNSTLCDYSSLFELRELLVSNGWDITTALCVMVFSLMHWPCSTTLLTVHKETKSIKWTALAFLIPTLCGTAACIIINAISRLFT
ncbi:MAG: ferrous iron transport protein B [Candidatus Fimenecus sp.]